MSTATAATARNPVAIPLEDVRTAAYASGMVVTRTPLRISFAGGGTDLSDFYTQEAGAVISCAIDKYVYVTVKRHSELFNEPIRVNYSVTEQVNAVDEIRNHITRECLRLLRIEPPIYVSTVADMPASTGLGGSSSFAVGLLHALHAYKGERVSASQLGEEACHIEIDVLGEPIGKQDQYAAAFGGLNLFRFQRDGAVAVEPHGGNNEKLSYLFSRVLAFYTGMRRDASSVLIEQKANSAKKFDALLRMRNQAFDLQRLMCNGKLDARAFGKVLNEGWGLKRGLASGISNGDIDRWYESGMRAGAVGGKICGAGGGGFLLFIVEPDDQPAVRAALSELLEVGLRPEVHGSRVLLPNIQ